MKISVISLFTVLAFSVLARAVSITPETPRIIDGCYQIGSANELYGFAQIVTDSTEKKNGAYICGKLIADITVNENVLKPNGNLIDNTERLVQWKPINGFSGIFDGNNKTISGLYTQDSFEEYIGLFGYVDAYRQNDTTKIMNLGIVDSYFQGNSSQYTGAIVGWTGIISKLKISNCFNKGTIEGSMYTGGIIGASFSSITIENCYNEGRIISYAYNGSGVGGIIGMTANDTLYISNCANFSDIGTGGFIGGIAGYVLNVQMKKCYNLGNLTSTQYSVGGLVNTIKATGNTPKVDNFSRIEQSYNSGNIDAHTVAGAIVASIGPTELQVVNSFSDGDLSAWRVTDDSFIGEASSSKVLIDNSFFTCRTLDSTTWLKFLPSDCEENSTCIVNNSFFLSNVSHSENSATSDELENGSVALKLHDYNENGVDGSVWGQSIGSDLHPSFAGTIEFNTTEAHISPKIPELVDGCYMIGNADELYGFASVVNGTDSTEKNPTACGKLTDDIVINERLLINGDSINARGRKLAIWNPIDSFVGTFDGQNHYISGLYIDLPKRDSIGFFKVVGSKDGLSPVEIKNLGFRDSYFHAVSVAAFVGWVHSPLTISNSYVDAFIEAEDCASGFVNIASELIDSYEIIAREFFTLKDCHARGILKGERTFGLVRLVDHFKNAVIENCSNESFIQGSTFFGTSGLVGEARQGSLSIINSYAATGLADSVHTNGLIGSFEYNQYIDNKLRIINSYVIGDPQKKHNYNGLLMQTSTNANIFIENSYYCSDSTNYRGGIQAKAADFANGTIAAELHNYKKDGVDGSIWGQDVGVDSHPTFIGEISGFTPTISKLALTTFDGDTAEYMDHYVEGHTTYLPHPVREGYVFAGWFESEDFDSDAVLLIKESDIGDKNLYARWFEIKTPPFKDDCYEIGNLEELFQFSIFISDTNRANREIPVCAKLTADITLNKNVVVENKLNEDAIGFVSWKPIMSFYGDFDGQGHTISGLYVNNFAIDSVGFIGSADPIDEYWMDVPSMQIKNLTIKDSYFFGKEYIGAVLGASHNVHTILDNIHTDALVVGKETVGGICGGPAYMGEISILNSHNEGPVQGEYGVGGLAGLVTKQLENSYNTGNVKGISAIGGVAGGGNGIVAKNLYNTGIVEGERTIGGIMSGCSSCRVEQVANFGPVIAVSQGAGIFGEMSGELLNSYNSGVIISTYDGAGLVSDAFKLVIANSFNTYNYIVPEYGFGGLVYSTGDWRNVRMANAFSINENSEYGYDEIVMTEEQFADGTVLKALQEYRDSLIDGKIWTQEIGKDKHPVFKGMNIEEPIYSSESITSSSSSEKTVSSSSENAKSSSSTKTVSSSSENAKSSSSTKTVSSSSEKVKSSASTKTSSSSSSSKKDSGKSSSSSKKNTSRLENANFAAAYGLTIDNRSIRIYGIRLATTIELFDMNGTLISRSEVNPGSAALAVKRPGRYILRIGDITQAVNIK